MHYEYLIFGAVAALIIGVAVYTFIRNKKIRKNGVEADAVVSRIEERVTHSDEVGTDFRETYYVTFTTADGKTVEAILDNAPGHTRVGDPVRIKYLPEKPHYVVPVK